MQITVWWESLSRFLTRINKAEVRGGVFGSCQSMEIKTQKFFEPLLKDKKLRTEDSKAVYEKSNQSCNISSASSED